jgi:hypothetical protein
LNPAIGSIGNKFFFQGLRIHFLYSAAVSV